MVLLGLLVAVVVTVSEVIGRAGPWSSAADPSAGGRAEAASIIAHQDVRRGVHGVVRAGGRASCFRAGRDAVPSPGGDDAHG